MLLLDTHAFVWLASAQDALPLRAKEAIRGHAGRLYLSSISAVEIGILVKRERLLLPVPPAQFLEKALRQHGVIEVPIDRHIALAAVALPGIHTDPFDRIIIATAHLHRMAILSRDRIMPTYPHTDVIWD